MRSAGPTRHAAYRASLAVFAYQGPVTAHERRTPATRAHRVDAEARVARRGHASKRSPVDVPAAFRSTGATFGSELVLNTPNSVSVEAPASFGDGAAFHVGRDVRANDRHRPISDGIEACALVFFD